MKKKISFFLFLLITLQLVAQKKQYLITGTIKDFENVIKNVHIINLATNQATFSNDIGKYRINVSIGDSLKISSIQYKTMYKTVSILDIEKRIIDINLSLETHELDEITIKNHSLTGNLLTDSKKTPTDINLKVGKSMEETIIDLAKKSIKGLPKHQDPTERGLAKITSRNTDPVKRYKGIGGIIGLGSKNKKKEKLKKIISNTFTSKNVIDEIGEEYFIKLGIKKERIYTFIDYCKIFNIKQLYEQKKILHLLILFKEKSHLYLKEFKGQ